MIKLYPSISILHGKVTRLTRGDYSQEKEYEKSPVDFARMFEDIGIEVTYEGPGHVTKTNLKTLLFGIKVILALEKSFKEQRTLCPEFKENQMKKLKDLETFNPDELTREEYFKFFEKLQVSYY